MSRQRHPYIPPVMKTSSVSLVVLAALLLAVPAWAQQEMPAADTPDEAAGRMKKNYQELIKRHDKNGDGRLDEEEKAEAHAVMRKEGGGRQGDRRKQLLKRFDKNGDGRLDDTERAEAEKARELLEKNRGAGKFREQLRKRFDQDGDGRLDDGERAAAEKFRAEQVKKFDQDGDGQLNDAEREVARQSFTADPPAGKQKKDR